jgi:hypothetical protein
MKYWRGDNTEYAGDKMASALRKAQFLTGRFSDVSKVIALRRHEMNEMKMTSEARYD